MLCQLSYPGSHAAEVTRLPKSFWSKVQVDENGCWIWTGALNSRGYGSFHFEGRARSTHRLAYEDQVGPIPAGQQLDHLCRVRACCNPTHAEPVTGRENQHRSPITCAGRTHCIRGHELAGDNLYRRPRGSRECKECRRAQLRRYRSGATA